MAAGADDAGGGHATGLGDASGLSAGDLFTLLWDALADILGTAAAATLLRRAAARVAPRQPELLELSITRESHPYRYTVPPAWRDVDVDPPAALRDLTRELRTLLGP